MKKMTLVPFGGLSNRIFAITSAIGFCRDNGFRLKVVWFKDWGMGAGFHQLMEVLPTDVEIVDAQWTDYRFDRPRKRNLWMPAIYQYFAFDRRLYEKEMFGNMNYDSYGEMFRPFDAVYMNHCGLFYEYPGMFRELKPTKSIQAEINRLTEPFLSQRTVGIHIRRGDLAEYSEKKSPLSLFISKMEDELKIDGRTKFFVASDSTDEKKRLAERFGDAVITSFKEVRRDTKEGIIDALIELYRLSATIKIYGTHYSTYSQLSAKLSNIPLEVLLNE
ncbi:MAG: hypothetical protein LBH04_03160 [Tannerellaceae bacterium]|jgi:hypothetical protein|nr:hypothetical protein [Tannerellaceae bacterium]